MNQEDKEALKEFLSGAGFVALVVGVLLTILLFSGIFTSRKPSPKNFEVVDHYKECDVIRYIPDYSAKYYYFLDCSSK